MPKATGIVIPFLQNKRVICKGKVEKTGVVQGAAVVCDCCDESFAPSAFEKHSGGTWHRPWQYIFVIETERNILYYRNQHEGRDAQVSPDDPPFPGLSVSISRTAARDPKEREKEIMTLKDVVPQKKMKRSTSYDSDLESYWRLEKKQKLAGSSPSSSPFREEDEETVSSPVFSSETYANPNTHSTQHSPQESQPSSPIFRKAPRRQKAAHTKKYSDDDDYDINLENILQQYNSSKTAKGTSSVLPTPLPSPAFSSSPATSFSQSNTNTGVQPITQSANPSYHKHNMNNCSNDNSESSTCWCSNNTLHNTSQTRDFASAIQKLVQDDLQMQQEINMLSLQSEYQFSNLNLNINATYGLNDFLLHSESDVFSTWNENDNNGFMQSLLM